MDKATNICESFGHWVARCTRIDVILLVRPLHDTAANNESTSIPPIVAKIERGSLSSFCIHSAPHPAKAHCGTRHRIPTIPQHIPPPPAVTSSRPHACPNLQPACANVQGLTKLPTEMVHKVAINNAHFAPKEHEAGNGGLYLANIPISYQASGPPLT
jgi:hypothetical protein